MLMFNNFEILFKLATSGIPILFSHFATADLEILRASANCSCDKPESFLVSFNFSPNVI